MNFLSDLFALFVRRDAVSCQGRGGSARGSFAIAAVQSAPAAGWSRVRGADIYAFFLKKTGRGSANCSESI